MIDFDNSLEFTTNYWSKTKMPGNFLDPRIMILKAQLFILTCQLCHFQKLFVESKNLFNGSKLCSETCCETKENLDIVVQLTCCTYIKNVKI